MILLLFSGNNFLPRNLISTDFHILLFNFIFHDCIKPVYAKYDLQQENVGDQLHAFCHTKMHFNDSTMRHATIVYVEFLLSFPSNG